MKMGDLRYIGKIENKAIQGFVILIVEIPTIDTCWGLVNGKLRWFTIDSLWEIK